MFEFLTFHVCDVLVYCIKLRDLNEVVDRWRDCSFYF